MLRLFVVGSVSLLLLAVPAVLLAGPRETFLQSEAKFIDFQDPSPEYTFSADTRAAIKEKFLAVYNRTLALIIRLEYDAERSERAIGARELSGNIDQLRIKLAYARTRLAEARTALNSIKADFERIFISDPRTTLRTRMSRIMARFEKEVAIPLRNAHTTLIGIALKLKETP